MIDADVIVTPPSTFDRLPPDLGDPDPTDLDRLLASLDHIALCCCERNADEAGQYPPLEAVPVHK